MPTLLQCFRKRAVHTRGLRCKIVTKLTERLLGGTRRSSQTPFLKRFECRFCRVWRGFAARTRRPSPGDKLVTPDMFGNLIKGAAAVAGRVLDLGAYISRGLAEPGHLNRRQMPVWRAGRAMQHAGIAFKMAGCAAQAGIAEARTVDAALNIEGMVARLWSIMCAGPSRVVVLDMTIGAAWM
jgi:hypothetical protein